MQGNYKDRFYILDFDRTLARTDDLRAIYEEAIETLTPVTATEIHEARERTKSNFDVSHYVREWLKRDLSAAEIDTTMETIRTTFIERARRKDLLEPYAKELLDALDASGRAYGILTTGGKEWQRTKIQAAHLEHIPHFVIPTTKKGSLIASWRKSDGTFLLPQELTGIENLRVKKITFLDDKTVSFQDIPPEVKGIRIISLTAGEPFEPELPLPADVIEVHGLHQVMKLIF